MSGWASATRWQVLLARRAWASGWASATHWANFQVRNFETWTSGWASATRWASIC